MAAAPISGTSPATIRELQPVVGTPSSTARPVITPNRPTPDRPDADIARPARYAPSATPLPPDAATITQFLSQPNIEVGLHIELLQYLTSLALTSNLSDPRVYNEKLKTVLDNLRRYAVQKKSVKKRSKKEGNDENNDAADDHENLLEAIRILENNAALRKNCNWQRNALYQG